MNIEFEIKNIKHDLNYAKKCEYDHVVLDVYKVQTLLTAYENLKSYNKGTKEVLRVAEDLEHQANKEAGDWEARCFELEAELEKEKEKIKRTIDFIDNKNTYFEDGENWQNILKIKEILEE